MPLGPWHLLLAFSRLVLRKPVRGGRQRARGLAELIQERCKRLQAGDWQGLVAEFEAAHAMVSPARRAQVSDDVAAMLKHRRAVRLAHVGEYRRAMATLTSTPLAPDTPETLEALRALHPPAPSDLPDWLPGFRPPAPLSLSSGSVVAALRGATRLAGTGPSGMSFEHLRDLFLGGDGLDQFVEVCSLIAQGGTPPPLVGLLASSRLIAISKETGGGVRPIAMGECLYRVVARALSIELRSELQAFFEPDQFAVATPGGCEALVWGVRAFTDAHPQTAVLQVDISNAFNSINRAAIFEGLKSSPMSGLIPFVRSFYGFASPLYFGHEDGSVTSLLSRTGTRQGDPLGGALFAFGHKVALDRAKVVADGGLFPTFADDTYILGCPNALSPAFTAYQVAMAGVGLSVAVNKCRLWAPPTVMLPDELLPDVPRSLDGLTVLGVPLGSAAFVAEALEQALQSWSRGLDELPELQDSQVAVGLLRQCVVARPRYIHRLVAPSEAVLHVYERFDRRVIGVVADLLDWELQPMDPTADSWTRQAAFPIKWGGLGLGDLCRTAPVAFLSSWAQVAPSLSRRFTVNVAEESTLAQAVREAGAGALPFQRSLQGTFALLPTPLQEQLPDAAALGFATTTLTPANLTAAIWSFAFEEALVAADSTEELARIRSVAAPGAGAWLHALPSHARTTFRDAEFLTALRLRLGIPDPVWTGLPCLCHQEVDPSDDHILRCGYGAGGRIAIHHALRDTVALIGGTAGFQVSKEVPGVPEPGRRADVVLFDRAHAQWRVLDVTICNPLQLATVQVAAVSSGAAAQAAETRKRHNFHDPLERQFIPLAAELFGCLGAEFHSFLSDCAHRVTARTGLIANMDDPAYARPFSQTLQHYREWVSCCLQRAQAHSLLSRAGLAGTVRGLPLSGTQPSLHPADADYTLAHGPVPSD